MELSIQLLYFLASLAYLVLLVLVLRRPKSIIKTAFLIFLFGCFCWTTTLYAYLFLYLGDWLLFIGRLNYAVAILIPLGLSTFFYYFPSKSLQPFNFLGKWFILSTTLVLFILTLFTPLIDKSEKYLEGEPVVELGSLYLFYEWYWYIFLFGGIILGFKKMKKLSGIEKTKLQYAFWPAALGISTLLVTNVILPKFGILEFFKISVIFLVPIALFTFYSIIRYRFLNIKLTITNTTKQVLAFGLATGAGILSHLLMEPHYQAKITLLVIGFGIFSLTYLLIKKFGNTHFFHKIFSLTSTEYFQRVLKELKNNPVTQKTLTDLEANLKKEFCAKLQLQDLKVILLAGQAQKYPKLLQHFQQHSEVLVTKELESRPGPKNKSFPYLKELQSLGEVCLPLFEYPTKELLGFLMLGEKPFKEAYSTEEIQAIQGLDKYLSLALMSILYNLELQTKVLKLNEVVKSTVNVTQHELRTPTSVVNFALETLKENDIPLDLKKGMINDAYQAAQKLQQIVEKIVNVQALETGIKLNWTDLNLYSFCVEITTAFHFPLKRKGLKLITDLAIPKNTFLPADRERLWQVFANLLQNTEKFTPKGGQITLQARKQKNKIMLKVIDTGEGVPKDKQELIFERFGTRHHNKGIALGLYICKKILELHQGRLWYENTKGGGATFCVSLPTQPKYA